MICVIDQERTVDRGLVCQPCRNRVEHHLRRVPDLYADIDITPGGGTGNSRPTGKPGSRMPLLVDALDLTMPARTIHVTDPNHDQIGHVSVRSILDGWVEDWRLTRAREGEKSRPVPTVPALVGWLLARLDWACDNHPAVDEFADEINDLHTALRAVTGDFQAPPQRVVVPCRGCEWLSLVRDGSDQYPVRCTNPDCQLAYTEEEITRWLRMYAAAEKERVNA